MISVYSIVGESSEDPDRLLALGSDGQHYALMLPQGVMFPVEPDEQWRMDPELPEREDVLLEPPVY